MNLGLPSLSRPGPQAFGPKLGRGRRWEDDEVEAILRLGAFGVKEVDISDVDKTSVTS